MATRMFSLRQLSALNTARSLALGSVRHSSFGPGSSHSLLRSSQPTLSGLRRGLDEFFDSPNGWSWDNSKFPTGRSWTSDELRAKSFEDLHQLWWLCAKEQNKLHSQQEECRRFRLVDPSKDRLKEVKRTMARIKQVLWERKQTWEQAKHILQYELAADELRKEGKSELEINKALERSYPSIAPFGSDEAYAEKLASESRGRKRRGNKTSWFIV
ncbi:mitochondrial 39-S ribosomal protein L47 (MRP-L47)-domain-containing protein [Polychytrium aggregatum]|uniref:mitochondrial 39-S ribosomal protein L47 (MRP-L47)-domain-containing protein n=1 Tax=Polychytrium aggregatum TaxID=110093 RepID=UPI0022FED67B|nr:mitochondrial 39-S ribosomal protein L47 (MRP-L47)-domain-containing protein [Polychytrium aggregatum]KAI9201920.1 mitochondrial 39-S ribosomal protein L47 (MRP-L47)-domain-containing protein [Polychytrium aggregatum]